MLKGTTKRASNIITTEYVRKRYADVIEYLKRDERTLVPDKKSDEEAPEGKDEPEKTHQLFDRYSPNASYYIVHNYFEKFPKTYREEDKAIRRMNVVANTIVQILKGEAPKEQKVADKTTSD